MRIVYIAVLILMFTSCTSETPYIIHCKIGGFVLADTAHAANGYLSCGDEDGFPMYYIGVRQDTICTGEALWRRRRGRSLLDTTPCISRHSPENLSITVDTLYPLTLPLYYFNEDGTFNADSTRYCHASTVVLTNILDTALYMGITYSLYYMHREMQNSRGEWVKMGDKLSDGWLCATGQPHVILKPDEVIIAKVCHYEGPHPVSCRLAFGRDKNNQVYSNVFTECVDDSMLRLIERR